MYENGYELDRRIQFLISRDAAVAEIEVTTNFSENLISDRIMLWKTKNSRGIRDRFSSIKI